MDPTDIIPVQFYEQDLNMAETFRNLAKFKKEAKKHTKLGASHQLTIRYIVKFFIIKWNKSSFTDRSKGFFLPTKNTSLANLCDCTARTIGNHIPRLIEAGIIKRKISNGKGLKLYLNPKILFDFSDHDRKNVPGLVPENSVENQRTILSGVDNLKNFSKNMEGQLNTRSNLYNVSIDLGSCSEVAKTIWKQARKYIYPHLTLSDKRELVLQKLIEKGVEKWYDKGEESEKIYDHLLSFIDFAKNWFNQNKEVTPPDPYHYFSSDQDGFRFWTLLKKAEEKADSSERQLLMRRIRISCFKLKYSVIHVSKFHLLNCHLERIKNLNNAKLNAWFLTQTAKLY